MRFILPTTKEIARAAEAAQLGFAEISPVAASARAGRVGRKRLAAGLLIGGVVFGLLACFGVLVQQRESVADLALGSLIGWLTILSILLAVRPMQAAGERACLALVLRRYGFGVVAIAFCLCWLLATTELGSCLHILVSARREWAQKFMVPPAIGVLGAAWGAAGAMLAQLIAEAGASHRELVGVSFQDLVRARAQPRGCSLAPFAEARIQSVVAGMTRSIERSIACDDLDDLRESMRVVSPVLRELVLRTPPEQLGWDYSSNNMRDKVDARRGVHAGQPVIVDIRLSAAISKIAAAPSLPPVPSLLFDLRHLWLATTFAAIRGGRPGIVAGSCAVAFTAYRDSHVGTRHRIVEHFVDAATEFMLVLRGIGIEGGSPASATCRRPVVALFAHLARLAAQRDEWDNFEHFLRPLADGCGAMRGDSIDAQHRALCGFALANLAGWHAYDAQNDQRRGTTSLRCLQALLAKVQAEVDLDALFRDVHRDSDEWNLGTEYWCSPALERRARFGVVAGGFVDDAFPARGAAVLKTLHDLGEQAGGAGATSIEEHSEYASKVFAMLAVETN